MRRHWKSGSEKCFVDAEGLHFDGLSRAPVDQDWGSSLDGVLRDRRYLDHLTKHYPPGTAEEVWQAVLEQLGIEPASAPSRPDAPFPIAPSGVSDHAARAFANLLCRIARTIDPTLHHDESATISWSALDRPDLSSPGYRWARIGGATITKELGLSDGVGGPVDVFLAFHGVVHDLEGASVRATWDGRGSLSVRVIAPAAARAAIAAMIGAERLVFEEQGSGDRRTP